MSTWKKKKYMNSSFVVIMTIFVEQMAPLMLKEAMSLI